MVQHISNSLHWYQLSIMLNRIIIWNSIHVVRYSVYDLHRRNLNNLAAFSRESSEERPHLTERNKSDVSILFSNYVKPRFLRHTCEFHVTYHISDSKSVDSDLITSNETTSKKYNSKPIEIFSFANNFLAL